MQCSHLCLCFYYVRSFQIRHYFSISGSQIGYSEELSKWRNGGGSFHESARIDSTAIIEIGAIIHPKAVVGANVHVGSGTVIRLAVTLGNSSKIGYNVCLGNCSVGDECVIHKGVCIGQDGFGFYVNEEESMVKKPQLLNAKIGNHVEIGANTRIDRGRSQYMNGEDKLLRFAGFQRRRFLRDFPVI